MPLISRISTSVPQHYFAPSLLSATDYLRFGISGLDWILQSEMPGRTRPIEKFARAVAKCSAEVNNLRMQSLPSILLKHLRVPYLDVV